MQAKIIQAILLLILLLSASYTDIKKREISPAICIMIALISFLDFKVANLFGFLSALPLLIIAGFISPNRLGGGDIKLVAATGLVLGITRTNFALILGLLIQILVFILVGFIKKIKGQEVRGFSLPLAPCLSLGFLVIYIKN